MTIVPAVSLVSIAVSVRYFGDSGASSASGVHSCICVVLC